MTVKLSGRSNGGKKSTAMTAAIAGLSGIGGNMKKISCNIIIFRVQSSAMTVKFSASNSNRGFSAAALAAMAVKI